MRSAVVLSMLLILSGCGQATLSPSPSLISADAARAAAMRAPPGSTVPVTVLSLKLSTYGAEPGTDSQAEPSTPIWAVVLSGSFPSGSCGPYTATPHPCPSPATTALVIIDARTGAFIESMVPAPVASPS